MKLDNEQLSRVFSAHENNNLRRSGSRGNIGNSVCIFQAAVNMEDTGDVIKELGIVNCTPESNKLWEQINWFDSNYEPDWTINEFIEQLIKQEII